MMTASNLDLMSERLESIGTTGDVVGWNIRRYRKLKGWSIAELSRQLGEVGRPISPLGLARIEDFQRRVDVDDLMALAIVLGVNPNALLLQPNLSVNGWMNLTGAREVETSDVWDWANGNKALQYTAVPIPEELFDRQGSPIPSGSMAYGKAVYAWRQHHRDVQDEDFKDRINPRLHDPELDPENAGPPHIGARPIAQFEPRQ